MIKAIKNFNNLNNALQDHVNIIPLFIQHHNKVFINKLPADFLVPPTTVQFFLFPDQPLGLIKFCKKLNHSVAKHLI